MAKNRKKTEGQAVKLINTDINKKNKRIVVVKKNIFRCSASACNKIYFYRKYY